LLFAIKNNKSHCQVKPRLVDRTFIFFPPEIAAFAIGDKVLISKVYTERVHTASKPKELAPMSVVRNDLVRQNRQRAATDDAAGDGSVGSIPSAASIDPQLPSLEISPSEFPEIYIPKQRSRRRRQSSKAVRDTTEQLVDSVKKILAKEENIAYSFLAPPPLEGDGTSQKADEPKEPEPAAELDFLPPAALTHVLDVSFFQTLPLAPVSRFQTLKFLTIRQENLQRDNLWSKSDRQLDPVVGAGFEVNFVRNLTNVFSMGWRYHLFDKVKTETTFDEATIDRLTSTETSVDAFAIHVEWGRIYSLWDGVSHKFAVGPELFQSSLEFTAVTSNSSTQQRDLLAVAQSDLTIGGLRFHYGWQIRYAGFGVVAGVIANLPLTTIKKNSKAEASVPRERLQYNGDARRELKDSLSHTRSAFGGEVYVGIHYQPTR